VARDAWRELQSTAPPTALDDVVRAYGAAGEALSAGELARALELLAWAKDVAPRSAVVREALGVARYQAGEYAEAQAELLAYRRLSARYDQNHVLADCARALGRHEKVAEYVDELRRANVPRDRVVEGLIVLAGDRADRGDYRGALAALEPAGLEPDAVEPWHPRVWYVAGDISDRMGDTDAARDFFEAIVSVDEDFLDAAERLDALS
jgi:tetratricopeptide (TPR) repeat protein